MTKLLRRTHWDDANQEAGARGARRAAAVSLLEPCEVETLAFHIQRVSEDRAKVDVEFVLDERMGTDTTGMTPPFSWETRGRTSDQRARGR